MRRRPKEYNKKQQKTLSGHIPRHHRPTDHRRKSTSRTANHDILGCPAFQPHRINNGIKETGKGQKTRRNPIGYQAHHHNCQNRHNNSKAQRIIGSNAPRRQCPIFCPVHHRINIAVIPHVESPRRASPDRQGQNAHKRQKRVEIRPSRCNPIPRKTRENHQTHHARLEQRKEIPCS